jgi:hypothetical protein
MGLVGLTWSGACQAFGVSGIEVVRWLQIGVNADARPPLNQLTREDTVVRSHALGLFVGVVV